MNFNIDTKLIKEVKRVNYNKNKMGTNAVEKEILSLFKTMKEDYGIKENEVITFALKELIDKYSEKEPK